MTHFETRLLAQVLQEKKFSRNKLYPIQGFVYEMNEIKLFIVNDDHEIDYVTRTKVRIFDAKAEPIEFEGELPPVAQSPYLFNLRYVRPNNTVIDPNPSPVVDISGLEHTSTSETGATVSAEPAKIGLRRSTKHNADVESEPKF